MADTSVTVIGNLTRDPQLRFTTSGKPVANIGVAVNRLTSRQGEEKTEEVSYFDVTCWDTLATNVGASLSKGDRVIVTGDLRQRSWENDDGDKRSKVEITAQSVGPDLRWAEAEVTKNAKSNGDQAPHPAETEDAPF